MVAINLYLQMIGTPPTQWSETDVRLKDGVWFAGQTRTRSVATQDGLFLQQLAERLWQMFDATLRAGKSIFDAVTAASNASAHKHEIGNRDLLCYVCLNRGLSIIRSFDLPAFERAVQKAKQEHPTFQLDGMTHEIRPGRTCSEIYMDQAGGPNIVACANNVYHEWMHNKTAPGEDPGWVHSLDGLAKPGGSMKGVTPLVATKMLSHLHNANSQFLEAVP